MLGKRYNSGSDRVIMDVVQFLQKYGRITASNTMITILPNFIILYAIIVFGMKFKPVKQPITSAFVLIFNSLIIRLLVYF